jgi:hypothetical protein
MNVFECLVCFAVRVDLKSARGCLKIMFALRQKVVREWFFGEERHANLLCIVPIFADVPEFRNLSIYVWINKLIFVHAPLLLAV